MQILDIKVLQGPNFWSNYRQKLIVLTLDLQKYENFPTHLLNSFTENLVKLIPSLSQHHCSEGFAGGFIQRLKEGTWLGHVVEHVALELQYLAGMDCTYGRTRASNKENVYYVCFSYEIESAGIYAAKAAVEIVQSIATGKSYYYLQNDIENLKDIFAEEGFGPSTQAIVKEAEKRNIPCQQLFSDSLVLLGQGIHQKKICAALTCQTSAIAVDLVNDKNLTKKILDSFHIPTPKGLTLKNISELKSSNALLNFPIVIKPSNGNHGRGVTTNIINEDEAIKAFEQARKISSSIIAEQYISGFDYRFLVINYKLVAVAKRKPASVIGDGVSTIETLINQINQDPNRGRNHENILTKIIIDNSVHSILQSQGLELNSVLPPNQEITIKYTANLSTGGTAIDVTDEVHPYNKLIAERIAKIMHLDICGIDIISNDIHEPLNKNNGAVIEVNAAPGLRMHFASIGNTDRKVAKHIIDFIYPEGKSARIPIIAVTGTNGKTTTVRLLSHLAMQAGYNVGYTTTDGIYLNHHQIRKGDCSGPASASSILRDPTVNYAVFECARGGILERGLGFDKCDISIVMNVSADHLGLGDIETLDDLARLKSVVPHSTSEKGYAILNADDDLVFAMKKELICNVALFSMEKESQRIKEHCLRGGLAAYLRNEQIIIQHGDKKRIVSKVIELPLTFQGRARFMIQNILAAVLAAVVNNFEIPNIKAALKSFIPSAEQTPGRMNLFDFDKYKVLVDYGHNVGAFLELKKFFGHINCQKKIGIFGMPGDRRNEDIENIGFHSAQIFDEIIIRHDKNGRGRTNQEITSLIQEGIRKHNPNHEITIISDEQQAIEFALQNAKQDSFIAYFPEDIFSALEYLKQENIGNTRRLD